MDLLRRLIGLLVLLSALALPLLREVDRPVEGLVGRWGQAPSEFLDLDGQLVHYRDEGPSGGPKAEAAPIVPTVVLLHGSSASLHTWDGWARALRSTHRVIRLDLPAFGLTGPFTGRFAGQTYTGDNYAAFVLAVLDRLGVQRFSVAGNSLGGEVAWRIAAQAPQRVHKLVLVDAIGYPLDGQDIPLGWKIARLPVLGRLTEHVLPRPIIRQGLASAYADPSKISEALVDRYFELTLREGNRAALVQRAQTWTPNEGVAKVTGVTAPTLVLWGGRDRLVPVAHAQRFAADIPGARVQVFEDLGHVPQEEDAGRTVAAAVEFLRDR